MNALTEWVELSSERPPDNELVLMWFEAGKGSYVTVDKISNRVVMMPKFWARIIPPNR